MKISSDLSDCSAKLELKEGSQLWFANTKRLYFFVTGIRRHLIALYFFFHIWQKDDKV